MYDMYVLLLVSYIMSIHLPTVLCCNTYLINNCQKYYCCEAVDSIPVVPCFVGVSIAVSEYIPVWDGFGF